MQGKRVEVNGQVYRRVLTAGQQADYLEAWQALMKRAAAAEKAQDAAAGEAADADLKALYDRVLRECIVAAEDDEGNPVAFDDAAREIDASDQPALMMHCLGMTPAPGSPVAQVTVIGRLPFAASAT